MRIFLDQYELWDVQCTAIRGFYRIWRNAAALGLVRGEMPSILDERDAKILGILQKEGRTTNVELARAVELTPSATLERVRKLEERGLIKGYRAILDPHALGLGLVMVRGLVTLHHLQLVEQRLLFDPFCLSLRIRRR